MMRIVVVLVVVWAQTLVAFQWRMVMNKRSHFLSATTNGISTSKERLTVEPISSFNGEVELPGSKSLSNRVLLLAALSAGTIQIDNLLDSADIQYMLSALKQLKIGVSVDIEKRQAVIQGNGGPFHVDREEVIFLGNAGTAMRPLAAVVCAGQGNFVLDGTPRMRERPIKDLVEGLLQLGVDISCSDTGCPPVVVHAKGLTGGRTEISGRISSQYLSALLMAAPLASGPITIHIKDELMSAPYVLMTVNLMKKFGVHVDVSQDLRTFTVQPGRYVAPPQLFIEGDASSASYFLAGAAIAGGHITVHGCGADSIQGDARFAEVLQRMGASVSYGPNSITVSRDVHANQRLQGIDEDCGDIPDVAMTLAIVGIFAEGKTTIRNVYNWRVKETERMVALVTELQKLGVHVEEGRDYLVVHGLTPGQKLRAGVEIETYDDHRVAMCFALAACGGVPVDILDPVCTSKTFPDYFQQLAKVTSK